MKRNTRGWLNLRGTLSFNLEHIWYILPPSMKIKSIYSMKKALIQSWLDGELQDGGGGRSTFFQAGELERA